MVGKLLFDKCTDYSNRASDASVNLLDNFYSFNCISSINKRIRFSFQLFYDVLVNLVMVAHAALVRTVIVGGIL